MAMNVRPKGAFRKLPKKVGNYRNIDFNITKYSVQYVLKVYNMFLFFLMLFLNDLTLVLIWIVGIGRGAYEPPCGEYLLLGNVLRG